MKEDEKLEQFIQLQLSRLPDLDAPRSLIPRVMRVIEAREHLPWWRRSLFNWPRPVQVIALAMFAVLPILLFAGGQWTWTQLLGSAVSKDAFGGWIDLFNTVQQTFATLGNAVIVILRSPGQPWIWAGIAVAMIMYLTCIGLGTACVRVALRKT